MTTLTDIRPTPHGVGSMVRRARNIAPRSILAGMLTRHEAAAYLDMTAPALSGHRARRTGPKCYMHRGLLLYKMADLDEWKAGRA